MMRQENSCSAGTLAAGLSKRLTIEPVTLLLSVKENTLFPVEYFWKVFAYKLPRVLDYEVLENTLPSSRAGQN